MQEQEQRIDRFESMMKIILNAEFFKDIPLSENYRLLIKCGKNTELTYLMMY